MYPKWGFHALYCTQEPAAPDIFTAGISVIKGRSYLHSAQIPTKHSPLHSNGWMRSRKMAQSTACPPLKSPQSVARKVLKQWPDETRFQNVSLQNHSIAIYDSKSNLCCRLSRRVPELCSNRGQKLLKFD